MNRKNIFCYSVLGSIINYLSVTFLCQVETFFDMLCVSSIVRCFQCKLVYYTCLLIIKWTWNVKLDDVFKISNKTRNSLQINPNVYMLIHFISKLDILKLFWHVSILVNLKQFHITIRIRWYNLENMSNCNFWPAVHFSNIWAGVVVVDMVAVVMSLRE